MSRAAKIASLMCMYVRLYFAVTVNVGLVWGATRDVESNGVRLMNLRPKEWRRLGAIRRLAGRLHSK
jgi:hypothetical protein